MECEVVDLSVFIKRAGKTRFLLRILKVWENLKDSWIVIFKYRKSYKNCIRIGQIDKRCYSGRLIIDLKKFSNSDEKNCEFPLEKSELKIEFHS
jgi:Cft2 family RNA processing exonuclease